MNIENSKTNEPQKFVLILSQRLDLKRHVALQNLTIYFTWKNRRQQQTNNNFKIIAPTWNDEFKLPYNSYLVSDIQNYIRYIIKKHKTLPTNPPIHIYLNRINNRLVFKIKGGYKLGLQISETMKVFGSTKN